MDKYTSGTRLYDDRNDRYINVDYITKGLASCTVIEYDEDGDPIKEYYQLFTLVELSHFKEV